MGNTDPSQNIQPAGAKFPANIRISPINGDDIGFQLHPAGIILLNLRTKQGTSANRWGRLNDGLGNLSPIEMDVQYIFGPLVWNGSTASSVLGRGRVASPSMDLFG
jgi:hypothetical protein